MEVYNFTGLSSEKYPVSIYNSGIFRMDADTETEDVYDLYVKGGMIKTDFIGAGVRDAGIYNYNANSHAPDYYINNKMTLTDLAIRNTNDSSAAITNVGGILEMVHGSAQGTYSGIDALVDIYGTSAYYIQKPVTIITDVEKIAGSAFSVRNTGEMTLNGENTEVGTFLTNKLDFASSYSGDYTAFGNFSTTVMFKEYYTSLKPTVGIIPNEFYAYFYSGAQEYSANVILNAQSATALTSGQALYSFTASEDHNYEVVQEATISYGSITTSVTGTPNYSYTWFNAGNYVVTATANVENVAFQSESSQSTTTAIMNTGDLTVKGINAHEEYCFTGFTVAIDNGATMQWASDIFGWDLVGRSPEKDYTVKGDYTVGFELMASTIGTSPVVRGEMILRGEEVAPGLYNGKIIADGAPYQVWHNQALSLVNMSVEGVAGTNGPSNAILNYGSLNIFNGVEQEDGSWQGASNAYIKAEKATAIENYGSLVLINAAVKESAIGIHQGVIGVTAVLNSTFWNNTSYAIVSDVKATNSTSDMNMFVANTTIATSDKVKGNGIQMNNGGRLDIVNSIVLTAGGSNIELNEDSTINTFGHDNTVVYVNADLSKPAEEQKLTDMRKSVFRYEIRDEIIDVKYEADENTVSLVEGTGENPNPALGVAAMLSYSVNEESYRFYVGDHSGDIDVTWDKSGNDNSEIKTIGSYIGDFIVNAEYIVNTFKDVSNDNDSYISLREAITALLTNPNVDGSCTIGFDWEALAKEAEEEGKDWIFEVEDGSFYITSGNIAGITSIVIDGSYGGNTTAFTVGSDELTAPVFMVNGMELVLSNFTINASGTAENAVDVNGAGVQVVNGGLTLENMTISGANASNGGAIYADGSQVVLAGNVTLENNTVSGNGGAVYIAATASLTVQADANVIMKGNVASDGAAIYGNGDITVTGGLFENNTATNGSVIVGADVTVSDAMFSGNTATNGSVIVGDDVTITDAKFYTNTATNGAVIDADGAISVNNAAFNSNNAANVLDSTDSVTVTGSTFSGNTATNGSVIVGADVTVSDAMFSGNKATNGSVIVGDDITVSGTEFADNSAKYIVNGDKDIRIADSSFTGNDATGAFILTDGNVSVTNNSLFTDNTAKGSFINAGTGDVTVTDSSLTGNTARYAMIKTEGDVAVDNSKLNDNSAEKIIYAYGADSSVTVTNSSVSGNNATKGAVIYGKDKVFMDESSMTNNKGTAAVSGGNVAIISTTIADILGRGTVKVDAGNNAYILNSTIADVSNNSGSLVEAKNAYVHNSIVVSNAPNGEVVAGTVVENVVHSVTNENSNWTWTYNKAFGINA